MSLTTQCWCNNSDFVTFSPTYLRCATCGTLASNQKHEVDISRVTDDDRDFYGREYWFSHQEKDFGFADIQTRARTDLPERCLRWLRTLLKYKLSPAKILELGSAHGGFTAMLRWAGFEAMGLELSPWVVKFAQETFQIPIVCGPIEDQNFVENSFDVIILMDVLEHLPDPVGTIRRCVQLLKPDGLLLIQTPCYPDNTTYQELIEAKDGFVKMLIPDEHLYLFSKNSVRRMFERLGCDYLNFEPPIFEYDMFFAASRIPLSKYSPSEMAEALLASPSGRLILTLLDLGDEKNRISHKWQEAKADRTIHLEQINQLTQLLQESEADRAARFEQIQTLTTLAKSTQVDLQAAQADLQAAQAEARKLSSYPEIKLRRKLARLLNGKP